MQKIIPHLWFDKEAREAAEFYVAAFGRDSRIVHSVVLQGTPSGDAESLTFELAGYRFMAISAGPFFKVNPAISFILNFDPAFDPQAREHLDELWAKLALGGQEFMPLQEYPFSKRYGWVQDKFGVSWQLMLTDPEGEPRPFIIPSLFFTGQRCGQAEAATDFYLSVFRDAKRGTLVRYPAGMEPDKEGTVMFTDFMLEGQWFAAMDSARADDYPFNEALSLVVNCDTQEEIDFYWDKLSAVPEAEQCGWLKDCFGLSWQITPSDLGEMLAHGTREQIDRITKTFLPMKKLDLAALRKAAAGV